MGKTKGRSNHAYFLIAVASVLSAIGATSDAFAMGDAPSTCPNRYDATITEMILDNGTHTFDPIQNPDTVFRAEAHSGYSISMTLRTADQSTQGNQENGTTWYSDNIFGYSNGHCVADVGANDDATVSLVHAWNYAGLGPTRTQSIGWNTFLNHVAYNVDWYDEFAPRDLSAAAVSSSQVDLRWSPPLNNDSPVTEYRIERMTEGSTLDVIATSAGSTLTYSDAGLSPSTTYEYRVSATAADGTSAVSNYAQATTFDEVSAPTTVILSVHSDDTSGNEFDGMWAELWQDGQIIQEGPTPFEVEVQTGSDYSVFMNDWENTTFDHWEDGSTDAQRALCITGDTSLTAFFDTNSQPYAANDSASTTLGRSVTVNVLANDSDPDGDALAVDSTNPPRHGTVAINPDGTATYTPNFAYVGHDKFVYQISDGRGGTDTARVSISVGAIAIPTLP